MFEQIKDELTRFWGTSADRGDAATTPRNDTDEENSTAPDERTSSHLFRCPSCKTVYIARTKETCGRCETAVAQVRSTLSR